MKKNLYEILEVNINASEDEIKSSYKRLSRKYHPDISKEENASNKMAEINAANDVLSSKEKRDSYNYLMGFNENYNDDIVAKNNYHNNHHYKKAQQYYNERYKYYTNTYQSNSETVVKTLTWTTIILGTLFWIAVSLTLITINIINANINFDLSDSAIYDLIWFIVISTILLGGGVLILIYFSQVLIWLVLLAVALSLISEYDSFLLYATIIYGSVYLLFLVVENEFVNYVSMFFIIILVFDKQFSNHLWLMLSLGMTAISILISIFILWPVIDEGDYVEWKQILFSTISFPIIGGIIMLSAYIIEKITY